MAIKGILFDKDDTIIDLATFWREPVRRLAVFLAEGCGQKTNEKLIRYLERAAGFSDGSIIPETPIVAGTNKDVVLACLTALSDRGIDVPDNFCKEGVRCLENACVRYGQIKETADFSILLPELKKLGCVLGIATSDSYEPAVHCLERLGIDKLFDMVLSADRVERAKPFPDMAEVFCGEFGLKPEEVCMIGDSDNDMRFAENSGIVGILYSPKDLSRKPIGADYVVGDLNRLCDLIKKI